MKKLLSVLLTVSLLLSFASAALAEGQLVVYSTVYDEEYNMIIDAFTEKYGVEVLPVQAGAGDLKARLLAECENPQADVMFGGLVYADAVNEAYLDENGEHKFLAKYVAAGDAEMPEAFRNTTGYLTWTTIQLSNLFVNKELLAETGVEIKGYQDLLQPELKGKIVWANPTASSSAWNHLVTMLTVFGGGDYESEEAWGYVEELIQNLGGVISSSSSLTYKGVANGEYVVGITYEAPCYSDYEDDDNVEVIYMEEGTCATPFASAMIKGAPNEENAKLFMDFVSSEEAQKLWAGSTARQANINLPTTNELLPDMSGIKLDTADLEYVAVHQQEIKDKFSELWAKYN